MTDGAHDVSLIAEIVDSVAHGFTINCQAFVVLSIGVVPALKCAVQMPGFYADQDIADDGQARYGVALVLVAATETLPGLLSQSVGPIRDGQVAAHPTQDCAGGDG